MQKYIFFILILQALSVNVFAQTTMPSDKKATGETINLFNNLKQKLQGRFLFGHQDDLAYGVNWRYQKGRSDVKEAAGDYPALYGWELSGIELDKKMNIDSVPFSKIQQFIKEGYQRGGVITISWHANSPLGEHKTAWDTTKGTVASIIPGGTNHQLYKNWLDKVAVFFNSLKGTKGEAIPVLFRPFHELTGSWFWWGKKQCTPEEYKSLWRFTFHYLTNKKKLHHLLWVYNTSDNFETREEFMERYPGDDVVDVLSIDAYQDNDLQSNEMFITKVNRLLQLICELSKEKNKIAALAETGCEAVPYKKWWTDVLLRATGENKISYALVWRNHGYHTGMKKMHYYAPYKGQVSAVDFLKFYQNKKTIFERDARQLKFY
ncbi:MAG: glycosyl hydrolase [Lacibacter sp.]